MIRYYDEEHMFCLDTEHCSYQFEIKYGRYLLHRYYGRKISSPIRGIAGRNLGKNYSSLHPDYEHPEYSPDMELFEFPLEGRGDYRNPAFRGRRKDGSPVFDFVFSNYTISNGLIAAEGLPSVYSENLDNAETLDVVCRDDHTGLELHLLYGVLPEYDAIIRWAVMINKGHQIQTVERFMGFCLEFPDSEYDMITMEGAWAREHHQKRRTIGTGTTSISSTRGLSSHQYNPSAIICRKETTEDSGEAYGFSLLYSGNFRIEAEAGPYGTLRCLMGINDDTFSWNIASGASFTTPQTVFVMSSSGLNGFSQKFHRLIRERIIRGEYRDRERPILLNNWEATYFDFDHKTLVEIADSASQMGMELFVLDDGWFGNRNDDKSALGDWIENKKKLSEGLIGLSREIHQRGMKFGLWFEPEMVSPSSRLIKEHPEWVLGTLEESLSLGRNQLVLNLALEEVQKFIITTLTSILNESEIDYVKWDANRSISEYSSRKFSGDQQGELSHRYVLGLYHILDVLTRRFPHVLFEGCAGGGGRFDLGILAYMPQFWTSDNTDAVSRLKIQSGASLFYPSVSMGAHVSDVPNHQVGRYSSLEFRSSVAMSGNLGYELDIRSLSEEEREIISYDIAFYKKWRRIIQYGKFYRLSPINSCCGVGENEEFSWMFVSPDEKKAVLFWFRRLHVPSVPPSIVRMRGLNTEFTYLETNLGETFKGDELMYSGIVVPQPLGDFTSWIAEFSAV